MIASLLFAACSFAADKSPAKASEPTSCVAFDKAHEVVGKKSCVTGQITRVIIADSGNAYLSFCEDFKKCPFTAVVFSGDMMDVGDVRALEGKFVELHGKVKDYKGTPEIVVRSRKQVKGDFMLAPLPAEFGADRARATNLGQYKREDKRGRAW